MEDSGLRRLHEGQFLVKDLEPRTNITICLEVSTLVIDGAAAAGAAEVDTAITDVAASTAAESSAPSNTESVTGPVDTVNGGDTSAVMEECCHRLE
jgi:hypothetical protein